MRKLFLYLSLVLLSLICVGKATSPVPAPYYEYQISGMVIDTTTGSLADISLELHGYVARLNNPDNWIDGKGLTMVNERIITQPDSNGFYRLVVANHYRFDSLKIGILTRYGYFYSAAKQTDSTLFVPVETEYTDPHQSGCNSCSVDPTATSKRIEKYVYKDKDFNFLFTQPVIARKYK